ncbi:MAG: hypothetical protein R3C20_25325 [Planctomycetaceae bacterium]
MGHFVAAAFLSVLVLIHWLAGRWASKDWYLLSRSYSSVQVNKPDDSSYDGIAISGSAGVSPPYKYRFQDDCLIICRPHSRVLPFGSLEQISVPRPSCVLELGTSKSFAVLMVDVAGQKACFRLSPNSRAAERRLEEFKRRQESLAHREGKRA